MTAINTILIATSSIDQSVQEVTTFLQSWSFDVVTYESDKMSSGAKSLVVNSSDDFKTLRYGETAIEITSIGAAWLRRPNVFSLPGSAVDAGFKLSLDSERKILQENLWELIPDELWLNPRNAAASIKHKVVQLQKAKAFGFKTPQTVVSNDWAQIRAILAGCKEIVFKMPKGFLYRENMPYAVHSNVFKNNPSDLPTHVTPYPGIWQEYIPKKREWRVTVVGTKTFSAAIYSTEKARDDWRKHQRGPEVEFRAEALPEHVSSKCVSFLGKMTCASGLLIL